MCKHMITELRRDLGGKPDVQVPFQTPDQGGFRLIKVLASGGQGEARLVHNRNGEKVVLKVYDKQNANAGGVEDLIAEMESMKTADKCPFVAHCFEVFQDQTSFYMISGANFGGDFSSVMKKAAQAGVPTNEDWFRNIFTQAFKGLSYMHKHALMHCDIKEPNLMLKTDNYANPEVVIIDLGLAQMSADQDAMGACGTPGFIPPETWETGVWYPRGDIFSMGVVCFQLLTDNTPDEKTGKAGIFTQGCGSMEDVEMATKTRLPPFQLLSRFPGIMQWLPACLEKQVLGRPKAPQVLETPWFSQVGAAGVQYASVAAPRVATYASPPRMAMGYAAPAMTYGAPAVAARPAVTYAAPVRAAAPAMTYAAPVGFRR